MTWRGDRRARRRRETPIAGAGGVRGQTARTRPQARDSVRPNRSHAARVLRRLAVFLAVAAAGCTTVLTRSPAPAESIDVAKPFGMDATLIRAWGDEFGAERADEIIDWRVASLRRVHAADIARGRPLESDMLALSGGGADGAFGAGLLAGWTARGDRPDFQIVTGVSTGAIIAVFAYLGPEYDDTLRDIYTNYATRDLLTPAFFTGLLRGTAVTDTSGFRRLIAQHIDDEAVGRLAQAHRDGRLLLIGTTNLDAARPVIWNVGEIAASGHPRAKTLIRRVIEASTAIPGAFEPVLIPVEIDGRSFDEMHVDGGATRQVLLYSPHLNPRRVDDTLGVGIDRRLYVIMNNRLRRPHQPVTPRLGPITFAAISSLIASAGIGDVVQLYAMVESERVPINIVSIPPAFDRTPDEPFDRVYMRALYDFGFAMGRDGVPWRQRPPGFPEAPATRAPRAMASR